MGRSPWKCIPSIIHKPAVEFSLNALKHDKFQAIILFTCFSYNSRAILPSCRDLYDAFYKVKVLLIFNFLPIFAFSLIDHYFECVIEYIRHHGIVSWQICCTSGGTTFIHFVSYEWSELFMKIWNNGRKRIKVELKIKQYSTIKLKHLVKHSLLLTG